MDKNSILRKEDKKKSKEITINQKTVEKNEL